MSLTTAELKNHLCEGQELPSTERDPTKLKWRCDCGNIVIKTRRAFAETPRCKECSKALRIASHPVKMDWPQEWIEEMTPEFKEKYYREELTQRVKIDFICPIHGLFSKTFAERSQGSHCPDCGIEKRAATLRSKTNEEKAAIKMKKIKTNREKFGVDWPNQNEQVFQKMRTTNMKRYGSPYPIFNSVVSQDSSYNLYFKELLDARGLEYIREYCIEDYRYDFKVDSILFEIDPTSTHNSTKGAFNREPLKPDYHLNKSLIAEQHGFQCVHIFEWEDYNKIADLIIPKKRIGARECEVVEIQQKEANIFLKENHLQGAAKMQTVCIALKNHNNLVATMTFGKPRYNKAYEWELIRLCFKRGTAVSGGSAKMFSYFLKNYNPTTIISYCDYSKFSGSIYEQLHFKLLKHNAPQPHWVNGSQHILNSSLLWRGFDKLVGEHIGVTYGKGSNNQELMRKHGFLEVYDCGQKVYIYRNEEIS